jgi:CRISPR/Cas system-associated exonuclease Cas4 (RecB family)
MSSPEPSTSGKKTIFRSPAAARRIDQAVAFLLEQGRSAEVVIVGASADATAQLVRAAAARAQAVFGWHRFTLPRLAAALAARTLGEREVTPVGGLPLEATCARIVHRLGSDGLGRFASIDDRPGLPRALARTLDELRMAGLSSSEVPDRDVSRLLASYEAEIASAKLVDRAEVLRLATAAISERARSDLVGRPLLLLDVPLRYERERELCAGLARSADRFLMTVQSGDDRTMRLASFDGIAIADDPSDEKTALARLQKGLFSTVTEPGGTEQDVVILSAPGESRECVEVARLIQREAEHGLPFDRMAVLLRSPQSYRAHLEEALRRASVPAHFARGSIRPDPAGRSFLALLACAGDGLSARRFAEYVSLGEVADATTAGAPPPPAPATERWFPPDEEMVSLAMERAARENGARDSDDDDTKAEVQLADTKTTVAGTLRAPRLWERFLVDAAVIGGRTRWEKRLAGRKRELELDLKEMRDREESKAARIERDIEELDRLRDYALPLLAELETIAPPFEATWGVWLDKMSALATRALRHPERVLSVLAELSPMADIGPVDLTEIRLVLERRLTELMVRPTERPYGRVYVASVEEARGLSFEVVFVPGLAERLFPQKVTEDPILPDRERSKLAQRVFTNADRSASERLMLRIAVGAAKKKLVLCYPRIDIEQSRPRTPSFYGLEVLRAAEGRLPGFDELARRAEIVGGARLGWPAPARPAQAIDAAEHDLSLLQSILERPEKETVGMARFLLGANPHLERALRFRARRWLKTWNRADGLVDPDPLARPALAAHALAARSFSPTALQHYASCPYKFVLNALHKLAPREEPAELEELDPLQRGSLIHDVQFKLLGRLRDTGLVPVTLQNLEKARAALDAVIDDVAARYKDDLSPAIERVWEDGIASIRADLREMLRRSTDEHDWIPAHFELSFGLVERRDRDPNSVDDPVPLDCGIKLRGSIDLVERRRDGAIRATDYKTGKARATEATIIGGGETLQPVLYALTLEKLFPKERVDSGRLYYCTSNGEFKEVVIPLDDEARRAANAVAKTVGDALEGGFLPAAPVARGCEWCDYRPVCGPYEETRTAKKKPERIAPLVQLRKRA